MEIARNWRLQKQRYGLVGEVCNHCGNKMFPPRDVCPHCAQQDQEEYQFSGKGEIYSFTTVYDAPAGFEDQVPYTMALVKLEEGPTVTAMLTDIDGAEGRSRLAIGQAVEAVIRRLTNDRGHDGSRDTGVIIYGTKFRRPLASED